MCHGCDRLKISKFFVNLACCNFASAACATVRMIDICVIASVAHWYLCDYEFSAH